MQRKIAEDGLKILQDLDQDMTSFCTDLSKSVADQMEMTLKTLSRSKAP